VRHILVVDDNPAIGHMLSLILQMDGYRVTAVTSGEAAIVALHANHFAVVLAEASLGSRGNGLGLCAYVRREWPRAKVILSTRTSLAPASAQACGADEVLVKPFHLVDLRRAIAARGRNSAQRGLVQRRRRPVSTPIVAY
jgi:DNA-binding response OmpR family regulator